MGRIIYLCGVSGSGKTSIVSTYEESEYIMPLYFSAEMKRIGKEKQYITNPEDVYRLPTETRQELEDQVREYILSLKSTTSKDILIDGHVMIEGIDGHPRPNFSLEQGGLIDHIIFLQGDPKNIVINRENRGYRPTSNDCDDIDNMQQVSIVRIEELRVANKNLKKDIIKNPDNDLQFLINTVKAIVGQ